ncbi:hypothetical protein GX618_01420 [Candidatus Dojkabacteria bacterium]|jgi:Tfp pilus assembly protein FimT|uniref:Type II secretion system protein n=1 Tax=Candidatus Dojkabacteria bacterium TaxID=2099670 RepID=A0A847ETN0_9BACT|nr:hypothetical protein [Candidatus Dojkabacteria bacterium]HRX43716.1 hypothetical protein [Candidatus Dojkabacteria bacterium]
MKNRLKGVTLIETMLYIGIFSIIIVIIINFMLSTQEATRTNDIESSLQRSSSFISQHLNSSFKKVKSIDEVNSIFNNDQGRLSIVFSTGNKEYSLTNSKLMFDAEQITPNNLLIRVFNITPIYKSPGSIIGINISITIESKIDSSRSQTSNLLYLVQ